MPSVSDVVKTVLNFADQDYFDLDADVLSDKERQLLDMDFFGLALNAPKQIDVASQTKLPLVLAQRCSGDRGWEVRLSENCFLAATNMCDGSVRIAHGLKSSKDLSSRGGKSKSSRGAKPNGLPIVATQITALDAREQLQLDWSDRNWRIGVVSFDWVSNIVETKLVGSAHPLMIPGRATHPLPEYSGYPNYHVSSGISIPTDAGIDFNAKIHSSAHRLQLLVNGSFSLPIHEYNFPQMTEIHSYETGDQRVAAIFPVTFIVLGIDRNVPLTFDWVLPVYGREFAVGDLAGGSFAIDAFSGSNSPALEPGDYVCYVVADGRIYGPQRISITKQ